LRDGVTIRVIGEIVMELAPDGRTLRTISYRDYTRAALHGILSTPQALIARWLQREQREEIRARLEDEGIDLDALATALGQPNLDSLDLLLQIAFGERPLTRRERADRVRREQADFFVRYGPVAREILEALLEKYVAGEAPDISDPQLLRVPPLSERGTFMELAQPFGGGAQVRAALRELQTLLYTG
jgi:type I restriction enzyme R subunit